MVVFKLLVAFALMVVLIRMKVPVGVTLIVGTLLLGLMFGMSVEELGLSIARSVIDLTTIRLVVLVAMVILLSEVMRQSGALKKIEGSVKLLFKDSRWGLATIPALIGLMPMPSGALISAPMIEPIADELRLDAPHRTFVNYWFRHIWEYSWPLYQALIIAAALLKVHVNSLIVRQFPLSIIAILIGYLFAIRPISKTHVRTKLDVRNGLRILVEAVYPLLIVLVISIIFGVELVIGLAIALVAAMLPIYKSLNWKKLIRSIPLGTVLVVFAVMAFKSVLNDSGAIGRLPTELSNIGLHPVAIVVLTPMLVGLLTGVSFSFVGIGFPLLLPFLNSWTLIALAYLSGFVGVLLSPVHLCLIFSARYYRAPLSAVYKLLYAPVGLLMALGALWTLAI